MVGRFTSCALQSRTSTAPYFSLFFLGGGSFWEGAFLRQWESEARQARSGKAVRKKAETLQEITRQ